MMRLASQFIRFESTTGAFFTLIERIIMSKMSLRKALQFKKNMAGEIAKLRSKISQFNCQRTANKHVDVLALEAQLGLLTENLILVKTALAKANVEIYEDILRADELKGLISFYEGLNTEEDGQEYKLGELINYTNVVAIDYSAKEAKIKALKLELELRLERIDDFNSSRYIEFAD